MNFYQQAGKMVLGSRLRRLSSIFTEDAAKVFALYDVALQPHWFPVFYVLTQAEPLSISSIAALTRQPHPAVSQIVKAMTKAGLTISQPSESDARVNLIRLSDPGKQLVPKLHDQYLDVTQAIDSLLAEMQYDLWKAIEETEHLLAQKNFYDRVKAQRKQREQQAVDIIDYTPDCHAAFKRLNYAWIAHHFTIEDTDRHYLEHPEERILNPGGHILMARFNHQLVGTCALVKIDDCNFEVAKMAVAEEVRGRGIGRRLGEAMIQKARELGAKRLLIQSNTALEAAISLYYTLGFKKIVGQPSPYTKCNIQMELILD
ncbi:MAG: bifunctional helix-turn-helix transcriptional regulator/GNAT family N-acetyltransferase [Leptolyngbya sp. SIO1E4]|nr:bifunctional helix-turn-helix transcriptional regulator/GNAT family N-acetyltransferase [Leptolyngbya sp. SIO1E4]